MTASKGSGRTVYINGRYVPEAEAAISIYDSALMFGDMVFEMTRSFNRKQFKLREHLERLYCSIKMLRIPLSTTQTHGRCYWTRTVLSRKGPDRISLSFRAGNCGRLSRETSFAG